VAGALTGQFQIAAEFYIARLQRESLVPQLEVPWKGSFALRGVHCGAGRAIALKSIKTAGGLLTGGVHPFASAQSTCCKMMSWLTGFVCRAGFPDFSKMAGGFPGAPTPPASKTAQPFVDAQARSVDRMAGEPPATGRSMVPFVLHCLAYCAIRGGGGVDYNSSIKSCDSFARGWLIQVLNMCNPLRSDTTMINRHHTT